MIRGLPYNPLDKQLIRDRLLARQLMHAYNQAPPPALPTNDEDLEHADSFGPERRGIMAKLCHLSQEQSGKIDIEPPFYWYVSGGNADFEVTMGTTLSLKVHFMQTLMPQF